MGRKVELVPHDPLWAEQYKAEAARLTAVFQPILVSIHHIGSTAISGIKAKPIIDIMIVVTSITAVGTLIQPMASLDYIGRGENGIPGRQYFRKGSNAYHTHHVHVYAENHPEIARHLDFRDYLRAHPGDAAAYSELKERLAQQYGTDPELYTDNKTAFIRNIDGKAHLWRKKQVAP